VISNRVFNGFPLWTEARALRPGRAEDAAGRKRLIRAGFAAVAVALLAARAFAAPPGTFEFFRLALYAIGLAVLCFAPYRAFLKAAVAVALLETAGGIVAFAFVDAPLVMAHRPQIVGVAASLEDRFETLQRPFSAQP